MIARGAGPADATRRGTRPPARLGRLARWTLAGVSGVVALTAIGGGLALVLGLEQANYGAELLETTPFTSYLWPGLILAIAVGGTAAAATVASIRRPALGGLVSMVAGAILIGWIVGEMLLLEQPSEPTVVEWLYLMAGVAMLALGAVVWGTAADGRRPSTPTGDGIR
jgi:hypothetical protein